MIECALLSLYLSVAERSGCDNGHPKPLIVEYYERPPYAWTFGDGVPRGISIDAARAALEQSGVPFRFVAVPVARQMMDVLQSNIPLCALARYKTPERERQAKFSRMLVEERPYVVFARRNSELGDEMAIDELLNAPHRHIVIKLRKSYGARIDAALNAAQSLLMSITGNALNAVRMVISGRADGTILTLDEVDFAAKALDLSQSDYSISRITGIDRGEKNYLMCSKVTDDAILKAIDARLTR